MKLKIALSADMQLNVGEKTYHREQEYELALSNLLKSLVQSEPDIFVVAGDVFERFKTTDIERKLWSNFVHSLLSALPKCYIIVIDGNHDIRTRHFEYFNGGSEKSHVHVLEELNASIAHPRYCYSAEARLLALQAFPNLVFACWSEMAKHVNDRGPVSPWHNLTETAISDLTSNNLVIDVYHGTVSGAKDMGASDIGKSAHKLTPDDVKFYGDLVMLGHIHKYQVLNNNMFYPSSLVPRTFNEGLRWHNGKTEYDYLEQHGYIMFHIDEQVITHEFMPIHVSVKPIALVIDQATDLEQVKAFTNQFVHANCIFKLVLNRPKPEVLAYLYDIMHKVQNWRLVTVESALLTNSGNKNQLHQSIQNGMPESVQTLDLNFSAFEPVLRKLLQEHVNESEEIIEYVLSLAKQECGYHLHPLPLHKTELLALEANNFLTLKHANVTLNPNELVRIYANNRVGKTSMLKSILFALTGLTYSGVDRSKLKRYHATLFNDKMPNNDISNVTVTAKVNGVVYEIHQALTKLRNREGQVTKIVHDTHILDVANATVIHQGPDAFGWLINVFGDFDTFNLMHFINVDNLAYLKRMNSDYLVKLMLSRLGYDSVLALQHFVNGCKAEEFKKCPKVSNLSSVQLMVDITNDTNSKAECTQDEATIDKLIQDYKKENETLSNSKMSLLTLNPNLEKFDTIQSDFTRLDNERNALAVNINEFLDADNKLSINDENLTNVSTRHSILSELNAEFLSKTSEYNKELQSYQLLVKAYDDKVNAIHASEDAIAVTAVETLTKLSTSKRDAIKLIDIEGHKTTLSGIKSKLKSLTIAITETETNITHKNQELTNERLNLDKIKQNHCHACSQTLNDLVTELTKQSEHKISQLEFDLIQLNATLDKAKQDKSDETIKETQEQDKINQLETDKLKLESELSELEAKIEKCSTREYKALLYKANNPGVEHSLPIKPTFEKTLPVFEQSEEFQKLGHFLAKHKEYTEALSMLESLKLCHAELSKIIAEQSRVQLNLSLQESKAKDILVSMGAIEQRLETNNTLLTAMIKHEQAEKAIKIYSHLVNVLLPNYLYDQARDKINYEMSKFTPPNGLCIKLSDTTYGELVLVDVNEFGEQIEREVRDSGSGAESAIALIMLSTALRNINQYNRLKFLMIDEISGPFHTGTQEDSTNWLEYFETVTKQISEGNTVLMIDQRIDNDIFDRVVKLEMNKLTNLASVVE